MLSTFGNVINYGSITASTAATTSFLRISALWINYGSIHMTTGILHMCSWDSRQYSTVEADSSATLRFGGCTVQSDPVSIHECTSTLSSATTSILFASGTHIVRSTIVGSVTDGSASVTYPAGCDYCDQGWWGATCTSTCSPSSSNPCFGHGICSTTNGSCLCEPEWNGDAQCGTCSALDACSVCGGDGTTCADCFGEANGSATYHPCTGVCRDPATDNSTIMDCNGRCPADACYNPSIRDCVGRCPSEPGYMVCTFDCLGEFSGLAAYDSCGVCGYASTEDCLGRCPGDFNYGDCGPVDCNGVPGGSAHFDDCGVCIAENETETRDCLGRCPSDLFYNITCLQCDGTAIKHTDGWHLNIWGAFVLQHCLPINFWDGILSNLTVGQNGHIIAGWGASNITIVINGTFHHGGGQISVGLRILDGSSWSLIPPNQNHMFRFGGYGVKTCFEFAGEGYWGGGLIALSNGACIVFKQDSVAHLTGTMHNITSIDGDPRSYALIHGHLIVESGLLAVCLPLNCTESSQVEVLANAEIQTWSVLHIHGLVALGSGAWKCYAPIYIWDSVEIIQMQFFVYDLADTHSELLHIRNGGCVSLEGILNIWQAINITSDTAADSLIVNGTVNVHCNSIFIWPTFHYYEGIVSGIAASPIITLYGDLYWSGGLMKSIIVHSRASAFFLGDQSKQLDEADLMFYASSSPAGRWYASCTCGLHLMRTSRWIIEQGVEFHFEDGPRDVTTDGDAGNQVVWLGKITLFSQVRMYAPLRMNCEISGFGSLVTYSPVIFEGGSVSSLWIHSSLDLLHFSSSDDKKIIGPGGQLILKGLGAWDAGCGPIHIQNGGSIRVDLGSLLTISSTANITADSSSTTKFDLRGNLDLNSGDLHCYTPLLNVDQGGQCTGSHDLYIYGHFSWSNYTFSGSGEVHIHGGMSLSSSLHSVAGTQMMRLWSSGIWDGIMDLDGTSSFHIMATASMDVSQGGLIKGSGRFHNWGRLNIEGSNQLQVNSEFYSENGCSIAVTIHNGWSPGVFRVVLAHDLMLKGDLLIRFQGGVTACGCAHQGDSIPLLTTLGTILSNSMSLSCFCEDLLLLEMDTTQVSVNANVEKECEEDCELCWTKDACKEDEPSSTMPADAIVLGGGVYIDPARPQDCVWCIIVLGVYELVPSNSTTALVVAFLAGICVAALLVFFFGKKRRSEDEKPKDEGHRSELTTESIPMETYVMSEAQLTSGATLMMEGMTGTSDTQALTNLTGDTLGFPESMDTAVMLDDEMATEELKGKSMSSVDMQMSSV